MGSRFIHTKQLIVTVVSIVGVLALVVAVYLLYIWKPEQRRKPEEILIYQKRIVDCARTPTGVQCVEQTLTAPGNASELVQRPFVIPGATVRIYNYDTDEDFELPTGLSELNYVPSLYPLLRSGKKSVTVNEHDLTLRTKNVDFLRTDKNAKLVEASNGALQSPTEPVLYMSIARDRHYVATIEAIPVSYVLSDPSICINCMEIEFRIVLRRYLLKDEGLVYDNGAEIHLGDATVLVDSPWNKPVEKVDEIYLDQGNLFAHSKDGATYGMTGNELLEYTGVSLSADGTEGLYGLRGEVKGFSFKKGEVYDLRGTGCAPRDSDDANDVCVYGEFPDVWWTDSNEALVRANAQSPVHMIWPNYGEGKPEFLPEDRQVPARIFRWKHGQVLYADPQSGGSTQLRVADSQGRLLTLGEFPVGKANEIRYVNADFGWVYLQ